MRGARALFLCSLALLPVHLVGQRQDTKVTWRFEDQRGGLCVWFLVAPEAMPPLLPKGVTARAASSTANLPASLVRLLADEPRFATWTPGMACAERFASVTLDGTVVGKPKGDDTAYLLTLTAFASEGDQPWTATELGTSLTTLSRRGGEVALRVADRNLRSTPGGENEDPTWEIGLDGAKLVWAGHETGESRVGTTRAMSFGYTGNRGTAWQLVVEGAPATERFQVGALRVEGKGALADAMKASPIRAVGPSGTGGAVELRLERLPRR